MSVARRALGSAAESWVARQLTAQGWQIIARNWRCPMGEIDLICQVESTLVFVEVRAVRTPYLETAAQSVSATKRSKVARAAMVWLQGRERWPDAIRFDVYAVSFQSGSTFVGEHFEAAFESPYAF